MTIEAAITSIKIACTIETLVIILALYNLIIQLINKNTTLILDMAVCHKTLVSVILA